MFLSERVGPVDLFPLSPAELDALFARLDADYIDTILSSSPEEATSAPLPGKQSLQQRFRDYHRRTLRSLLLSGNDSFSPGPAMDRFRDLPPLLVLAVLEGDLAVLEPGGVGPLPLGHPVIAELWECINVRRVTPGLLSLVRECTNGRIDSGFSHHRRGMLYDGGFVIGVLDYRKSAFSSLSTSSPSATTANTSNASNSILAGMATQGVSPEMHKVYLRPTFEALLQCIDEDKADEPLNVRMEFEAELLTQLSPRINTDPSPANWQAMEWALFDRDKLPVLLPGLVKPPEYTADVQPSKSGPVRNKKAISTLPPLNKIKQLAAIEEARSRKVAGEAEAFLGIDQRRNLARTRSPLPTTIMNNPGQRVWRTVRFERDPIDLGPNVLDSRGRGKMYYSVNVLALPQGTFEVILRQGSLPDTAQGRLGFTERFRLPTLAAVEAYIAGLRQYFAVEDAGRRVTVDVSNPAVLQTLPATSYNPSIPPKARK